MPVFSKNKFTKFSDFIPWREESSPGVVLNKNGSFLSVYEIVPPDTSSRSASEIETIYSIYNNAFKRLPSGMSVYLVVKRTKTDFSCKLNFPKNQALQMIASDREKLFNSIETFKNRYFLVFCYLPSPIKEAGRSFYTGKKNKRKEYKIHLENFSKQLDLLKEMFFDCFVKYKRLKGDALASFLHSTVSTKNQVIKKPLGFFSLDQLSDQTLSGGFYPKLGDYHLRVVSVKTFAAGLLDSLQDVPFEYRFVIRYVPFSDPVSFVNSLAERYHSRRHRFMSILWSAIYPEAANDERLDLHSEAITDELEEVLDKLNKEMFGIGYCTINVFVWDKSDEKAGEKAKTVEGIFSKAQFVPIREKENAVEAFLGSIPGNLSANPRKLIITSMDFSRLIPSGRWPGQTETKHLKGLPLIQAYSGENNEN